MGQFITLFELIILTGLFLFIYLLIKTLLKK
jgi:hypothetical protein